MASRGAGTENAAEMLSDDGSAARRDTERLTMILEVATLDVRSGQETAFKTAFASALPLTAATAGYGEHENHRGLEQPSRNLLLVRWHHLEDHTVGFRQSPRYHEWRTLLHHFYDPFPTVQHFARVGDWPVTAGAQGAAQ